MQKLIRMHQRIFWGTFLFFSIISFSALKAQEIRDKGTTTVEEEKKIVRKTYTSTTPVWVRGKVIDKNTGKGIANVPIQIVDLTKGLGLLKKTSNHYGRFEVPPIKGYKDKTLTLVIQGYKNMPPVMVTVQPKDKEVIIYKVGESWSWTKK